MTFRTMFLVLIPAGGLLTATLAQVRPEALEKVSAQKELLEQKQEEEGSILSAMEEIDRSIQDSAEKLEDARGRQKTMEARMGELERERQTLEEGLAERRVALKARLRALYKYSSRGFLQAMMGAGSGTERLQRMRTLQQVVRRDMGLLEDHRASLQRLASLKQTQELERAHVAALTRELEEKMTAEREEQQKKQSLLASIRAEKGSAKRVLEELERAATRLNRALTSLPEVTRATTSAVTSPGTQVGAPVGTSPGTGPGTGPGTAPVSAQPPPASPPPEKEARSQPEKTALLPGLAGVQGRCEFPVPGGKVTRGFGRYKDPEMMTYEVSRGVDISAPAGTPIVAVAAGEVKKSDWFNGYGLLMIVDHGGGYHSIYSHASKLLKKVGDRVALGEKIALVGDTGSFQGAYLYLEIRKDGKPVNPLEFLRVPPDAMQIK